MARTKNYYVVIKGKQNYCIFTRWTDCSFCVKGVSGAKYKGFETGAEAIAYLEGAKNGFMDTEFARSKMGDLKSVNTYNVDNPYTKYKNKVNNNNSSNNSKKEEKQEGIYDNINSVQFKYKQLQNKNLNISKKSYYR